MVLVDRPAAGVDSFVEAEPIDALLSATVAGGAEALQRTEPEFVNIVPPVDMIGDRSSDDFALGCAHPAKRFDP